MDLTQTQLLPAAVEISASLSQQLMRGYTSKSGAGCAAKLQSGSACTKSPFCKLQPSQSRGPRFEGGACQSQPRRNQLRDLSTRQFFQFVHGHVAFAAFDLADVRAVDTGTICQKLV